MSNFDIFVDSAANLPDDIIAATGIKVIPFISTVNGEELICYKNGKSFSQTAKEFYEKMAEGAEAKTSLISEERFIDEVTPSLEEGKDAIIITLAEPSIRRTTRRLSLKSGSPTERFTPSTARTPLWAKDCSPWKFPKCAAREKRLQNARSGSPRTFTG